MQDVIAPAEAGSRADGDIRDVAAAAAPDGVIVIKDIKEKDTRRVVFDTSNLDRDRSRDPSRDRSVDRDTETEGLDSRLGTGATTSPVPPDPAPEEFLEDNELSKVRASSRRTSVPVRDLRSKTPIMGDNVPRLSRHNSEELLMPRGRRAMEDMSSRSRMSIEKSLLLPIDAKNHHRTASLRRNREKRKKKERRKSLKKHGKSKTMTQLDLSPLDDNSVNSINSVASVSSPKGAKKDGTFSPKSGNKVSFDFNEGSNDNEVKLEIEKDEAEDYKQKFLELEKQFQLLQLKYEEQEKELSSVKSELKKMKDASLSSKKADKLVKKTNKRIDKLSDNLDILMKEADLHYKAQKTPSPELTSTAVNARKNVVEVDLPQAHSCVLFGHALF